MTSLLLLSIVTTGDVFTQCTKMDVFANFKYSGLVNASQEASSFTFAYTVSSSMTVLVIQMSKPYARYRQ